MWLALFIDMQMTFLAISSECFPNFLPHSATYFHLHEYQDSKTRQEAETMLYNTSTSKIDSEKYNLLPESGSSLASGLDDTLLVQHG